MLHTLALPSASTRHWQECSLAVSRTTTTRRTSSSTVGDTVTETSSPLQCRQCSGVARGLRSTPGGTLPGAANGRKFCTILKHPIDPNLTFYENNTSPATCNMVNLSSIGLVHLNRMSIGPATKGRQNTSTAPGGQTSCYATATMS